MAPRRRRNESASNDFDEYRFHNLDAQTSYHGIFSKRCLYQERDVTLSELQFTCIPNVFESRGWILMSLEKSLGRLYYIISRPLKITAQHIQ